MLKEKNIYKEDLPVNVVVAHLEEYPIHFHDDMEVVYVLEGSVGLKNGYYNYVLKQGDIFILNDREIHSFTKTSEDNMVMMMQLNLDYFSKYYDNLKNNFFVTDMHDAEDESLEILRSLLATIMMEILQKGYDYEHKVIETVHNVISTLRSDFQYFLMEDGRFINGEKNKGNKILAGRMNRITDYMYDNYTRKLTLNEIAEREHLSIYYLSHVIKEATGLNFQDLLSFIRVEESEKLLLGTNKKIGVISDEMGFSAVRYYIKHFRTWFGMHPLEYRKQYTDKVSSREIHAVYTRCEPEEIEEAIRSQVKGVYRDYLKGKRPDPIIIEVELEGLLAGPLSSESAMDGLMTMNAMKPISRPYNLLQGLSENVLSSGDNYIVTTAARNKDRPENISILLYNINSKMKKDIEQSGRRERVLEIARNFDEEAEFLVRVNGMAGEFKVSRYKLTRENALTAFHEGLKEPGLSTKRESIISSWAAFPSIEFRNITTTESISIRSTLKGLSAELILVDRK